MYISGCAAHCSSIFEKFEKYPTKISMKNQCSIENTLIEANAENANFRLSFNIGLHIGRDEMCINSDKDE